jgi:hypothetical protein
VRTSAWMRPYVDRAKRRQLTRPGLALEDALEEELNEEEQGERARSDPCAHCRKRIRIASRVLCVACYVRLASFERWYHELRATHRICIEEGCDQRRDGKSRRCPDHRILRVRALAAARQQRARDRRSRPLDRIDSSVQGGKSGKVGHSRDSAGRRRRRTV